MDPSKLKVKRYKETDLGLLQHLIPELFFPLYVIIYDGELSEGVIMLIVINESFCCNIPFLK